MFNLSQFVKLLTVPARYGKLAEVSTSGDLINFTHPNGEKFWAEILEKPSLFIGHLNIDNLRMVNDILKKYE